MILVSTLEVKLVKEYIWLSFPKANLPVCSIFTTSVRGALVRAGAFYIPLRPVLRHYYCVTGLPWILNGSTRKISYDLILQPDDECYCETVRYMPAGEANSDFVFGGIVLPV